MEHHLKNKIMYNCWFCGGGVSWVGDFMESEVCGGGDIPENRDRVVSYYHCSHCGSDFEFRQGKAFDDEDAE